MFELINRALDVLVPATNGNETPQHSIDRGSAVGKHLDRDALTGLPNHTGFVAALEENLATAHIDVAVAVLTIDIDRFKSINDIYGYRVGDQALVRVAQRLESAVGDAGLVARMGGDEFAIMVAVPGPLAHLRFTIDRLCADIVALNSEPATIGTHKVLLQLSLGVAFRCDEPDAGALLRHADIALHSNRTSADGPVGTFDPAVQRELKLRRSLADELPGAIDRSEIAVLFQPIVELHDRRVIKFEVLSRWHHPIHGPVPPSLFFDVAEKCDLIRELDHYVIRRALVEARTRLSPGGQLPVLSVNVSALSLTDELPTFISSTLREFDYPAHRVCVEITETSSITDMGRTTRVLNELDALGIVVSLDDFGTGFSSLTYLHHLPIGALKIDRSFVADMLTSHKAFELVRSILYVARSLDLPVVAEGIETAEQALTLQNLGCEQGQGYYFARPASAEAACETIGHSLPLHPEPLDPVTHLLPEFSA